MHVMPGAARCLELLGEAREWGTELNEVSYNMAISACARRDRFEEALRLLREMPSVGLVPDGWSYGATLGACAGTGQASTALRLFREMEERGIEATAWNFKHVLHACYDSKTGENWEAAAALLRRSETLRNNFCYGRVIMACRRAGQWQKALVRGGSVGRRCFFHASCWTLLLLVVLTLQAVPISLPNSSFLCPN